MEGMGSGAPGGVIGSVFGNATPQPVSEEATPKKIAISSGVATGNASSADQAALSAYRQGGPAVWYGGAAGHHLQDGTIKICAS
jgi:hypothetical protein